MAEHEDRCNLTRRTSCWTATACDDATARALNKQPDDVQLKKIEGLELLASVENVRCHVHADRRTLRYPPPCIRRCTQPQNMQGREGCLREAVFVVLVGGSYC